jgi:hypothetical protein
MVDQLTYEPFRRIAVIARDWLTETRGKDARFTNKDLGFAPFFAEIARCCSAHRADLLLFCLWTHSEDDNSRLQKRQLFPVGTYHRVALIEVTREGKLWMELWFRTRRHPVRFQQYFSRSSARTEQKKSFISDLDRRELGECLIVVCGESNIVNTRKGVGIVDAYHFRRQLRQRAVRVILNPLHDYMRRYEMVLKRAALSRATQIMVSVWNRGSKGGAEARLPWQLYFQGRRRDEWIQELNAPVIGQPGVRVGIVDLDAIRRASVKKAVATAKRR